MEKIRKKVKDKQTQEALNFVEQNALGNPIILQKTPASPSDMKGNTLGIKDDKLYIRFANGKLYEFSGTEIT